MSKKKAQAKSLKSPIVIWGGLTAVILIVIGAVWFFGRPDATTANAPTPGTMTNLAAVPDEWGMGNPDAKLRIVEFGDYQCGACGYYHPIVKDIMDEFGDDVYFVFRHFPLVNAHQFAVMAASAAEAAGRQGKFWEMHDLIMTNQQAWSRGMATSAFLAYARELGLNDVQFQQDVRNTDIRNKIERDYAAGLELNINSVPTFFFNGTYEPNPRTPEAFRAKVLEYLAK